MNILIVSEYIAPKQTIGSVRWTKIAKYLKKHHQVEIDVITTKNVEWGEDSLLKKDLNIFSNYFDFNKDIISRFLNRFIGRKDKKDIRINSANASSFVEKRKYEPDTIKHRIRVFLQETGMKATANKAVRVFNKNKKKYDVIISSYGPIWCHLAARKIVNENSNTIWIADFRDVFAGNKYESEKDFLRHKVFVSKYLKKAKTITKVAPDMDLYESDTQSVFVIPNGYDIDESVSAIPPSVFSIVYTGTLYDGATDLAPLCNALANLHNKNMIDLNDVVIEYAGRSSDMFNNQILNSGVNVHTIDHGLIERKDAIKLQQNCAILLQASSYDSTFKPLWTGKMFEYMMIKKPIVYLIRTDCHTKISDEIHKIGGIAFESCIPESLEYVERYIYEKYIHWKKTGDVAVEQDQKYIDSFSYDYLSEQVWNLIK